MRPQLGSAPAMAVFTSGLSATVLAICWASSRVAQPVTSMRDQVRGAFAVVGDRPGQLDADLVQGAAETCCRSAPASGDPPAAPLASSSTVSLVLMCPSTLMQLKLSSTARRQHAAGRRPASSGGVGQHDGQHRGHVGADHRRPPWPCR